MLTPRPPKMPSALCQRLEKRFMFDAAAAATIEKGLDLSQGANQQEQHEVLAALADNSHAVATQSLYDVFNDQQTVNDNHAGIKEVIFIDSTVQNPEEIIAGISRDAAVEIIKPGQNGLDEIAAALKNYSDLTAIHIISHGDAGQLFLGNLTLDLQNMNQYSSELSQIGQSLSSEGDILLYGCNVASEKTGIDFVHALSEMTGADIEAADHAVGGMALGGSWDLDYSTGQISTDSIINSLSYHHLLNIGVSVTDQHYLPTGYLFGLDSTVSFTGLTDGTINSLLITINNFQTGDTLGLYTDAHITTDANNNIYHDSYYMGSYTLTGGTLAFNLDNITTAQATEIARHLTFRNPLTIPVMTTRNITYTIGEASGSSGSGTLQLTFNDPPFIAIGNTHTFYAESGFKPLYSDTSALSGETFIDFTLGIDQASGSDQLNIDGSIFTLSDVVASPVTTTNGLVITATQPGLFYGSPDFYYITVTLNSESSPTDVQTIVNTMTFKPDLNTSSTRIAVIDHATTTSNQSLPSEYIYLRALASVLPIDLQVAISGNEYVVTESAMDLARLVNLSGIFGSTITTMSVTIDNYHAGDTLGLNTSDGVFTINTFTQTIYQGNAIIGTYSISSDTISFTTNNITEATAKALFEHVTFTNTLSSPNMDTRHITFSIEDLDNRSASGTMDVTFNSSPLVATGTNPTFHPGDDFKPLFSNAQSLAGQTFESFTLQVNYINAADQFQIDGTTFTLADVLAGTIHTAAHGLDISAAAYNNDLHVTLTVTLNGQSQPTQLDDIIESISFKPVMPLATQLTSRYIALSSVTLENSSPTAFSIGFYVDVSTSSSSSGVGVHVTDVVNIPGNPFPLTISNVFTGLEDGTITSLVISIDNPALGDTLSINTEYSLFFTNSTHNIYYQGSTLIGTWEFVDNTFTCILNNVSATIANELAQAIRYENTLGSPILQPHSFTFSISDDQSHSGTGTMRLLPAALHTFSTNPSFQIGDGFKPLFADTITLTTATFLNFGLTIYSANAGDQLQIDGTTFTLAQATANTIHTTNGLDISATYDDNGTVTNSGWILTVTLNDLSQAIELETIINGIKFQPVSPFTTLFRARYVTLTYVTESTNQQDFLLFRSSASIRLIPPPILRDANNRDDTENTDRFEFKDLETDLLNNDINGLNSLHLEIPGFDAYKNATSDAERDAIISKLLALLQQKTSSPAIANTLYEIAVDKTNTTNTTDFLTTVVKAITNAAKSDQDMSTFLGKVANDSRLAPDHEIAVINSLIDQHENGVALALIKKFEDNKRLDSHPGGLPNCTP